MPVLTRKRARLEKEIKEKSKITNSKDSDSENETETELDLEFHEKLKVGIFSLPFEVILYIFSHLKLREVSRIGRVCKKFHSVSMFYFSTLKRLTLEEFHTDEVIDRISTSCPRLFQIDAKNCQFTLQGFQTLSARLPQLKEINFPEHISLIQLQSTEALSALVCKLSLSRYSVMSQGFTPSTLNKFPKLNELRLLGFEISTPLVFTTELQSLRLQYIDFSVPHPILPFNGQSLLNLTELRIDTCGELPPDCLISLTQCTKLKKLSLIIQLLPDRFLQVAHFPNLQFLELDQTKGSPKFFSEFIFNNSKCLKDLSLLSLNEEIVLNLRNFTCPATSLVFGQVPITSDNFFYFLQCFPELAKISLRKISGLENLKFPESLLDKVTSLTLQEFPDFDNTEIEKLISQCTHLNYLYLYKIGRLRLDSFNISSQSLGTIKFCISLTHSVILNNCPNLQILELMGNFESKSLLDNFEIQSLSSRLVQISLPKVNPSLTFWKKALTSIRKFAPNLRLIETPYDRNVALQIRKMKIPYILSLNVHDIIEISLKLESLLRSHLNVLTSKLISLQNQINENLNQEEIEKEIIEENVKEKEKEKLKGKSTSKGNGNKKGKGKEREREREIEEVENRRDQEKEQPKNEKQKGYELRKDKLNVSPSIQNSDSESKEKSSTSEEADSFYFKRDDLEILLSRRKVIQVQSRNTSNLIGWIETNSPGIISPILRWGNFYKSSEESFETEDDNLFWRNSLMDFITSSTFGGVTIVSMTGKMRKVSPFK